MAIKLDMEKAYDRVSWNFLELVMKRMGFAGKWINMVMRCITTVEYSIECNGDVLRSFKPTRGLRQGDPLSPHLFLLIADVLSRLMLQEHMNDYIQGYKISRRSPTLTHIHFADDTLLFGHTRSPAVAYRHEEFLTL